MRQAGILLNEQHAQRFADFLVTQGITAHAEEDGDGWAIWVREENHLDDARTALDHFRLDPDSKMYRDVARTAEEARREELRRRQQAAKNVVEMRGRWNRPAVQRRPLTVVLIVLSAVVFLSGARLGAVNSSAMTRALMFCDPVRHLNGKPSKSDDLAEIRQGQVWRLVTPIFLHADTMHIVFNMLWLFILGGQIEERRGTVRLGAIVLATGVLSNVGQFMMVAPFFGGMSGVVYGLLGYIWMKAQYDPNSGMFISPTIVMIMVALFLLGAFGVLESVFGIPVANWAHGVGLAAGMAIGYAPIFWRDLWRGR